MDADDKRMRKQRNSEILGEAWSVTYLDHDFYVIANALAGRCCISG